MILQHSRNFNKQMHLDLNRKVAMVEVTGITGTPPLSCLHRSGQSDTGLPPLKYCLLKSVMFYTHIHYAVFFLVSILLSLA